MAEQQDALVPESLQKEEESMNEEIGDDVDAKPDRSQKFSLFRKKEK